METGNKQVWKFQVDLESVILKHPDSSGGRRRGLKPPRLLFVA